MCSLHCFFRNRLTDLKGTGHAAIKGMKHESKHASVHILTFTWDSNKNGTGKNAYTGDETINILLYGPGGVKNGKKVMSLSLHPADFENGTWTGMAGGNYAITVTESGGKYTIKIGGVNAGTKYTAQIQVVGADKISKASTFTGTTKKYVAPKH